MTTNRLHADDPRLTAYALGELDIAERSAIERELSLRPELRAEVEQIQRTAGLLARALEAQPVADLARHEAGGTKKPRRVLRKWIAAACVTAVAAAAVLLALSPAFETAQPNGTASYLADSSRSMMIAEEGEVADRTQSVQRMPAEARAEQTPVRWHSPMSVAARPAPARAIDPEAAQPSYHRPNYLRSEYQSEVETAETEGVLKDLRNEQAGKQVAGKQVQQSTETADSSQAPGDVLGPSAQRKPVPTQPTLGKPVTVYGEPTSGKPVTVYGGYASEYPGAIGASPRTQPARNEGLADQLGAYGMALIGSPSGEQRKGALMKDGRAPLGTESYNPIVENPFIPPEGEQALSTFSIDVDTASYSNVRRFLKHGQLPPRDAVRIEELVNYFDYRYPQPPDGVPFSVTTEVGPCPWQPEHRLVRIGLKGREIEREQRPVSNLVFLLDVSGSMQPQNKLPLVKSGMELLVEQLNENDRISIVTYAGNAGLVLEPTSGDDKQTILSAIRSLQAGGSTNGEAGIKLAYTQAIRNFAEHGSNRVILCTDGDFNVGVSSDDELVAMIQEKAKQSRVYLSIFGFGMGNLKDAKLEQLANKGNGHYGYIDDLREAKKVFSEELMGTLYTIAKDVKIQVEFNPQRVGAYRLIGYENRALANRDFTDDTKDAGEIGAGHTVTALYEVAPVGKVPAADTVDLKYQKPEGRGQEAGGRRQEPEEFRNELLTVKLRYKLPNADSSIPLEFPLVDDPGRSLRASRDFDWAAAVAAFGMVLRDSRYKGQANLGLVRELAEGALGAEPSENRREFLDLIDAARSLIESGEQEGTSR